VHDELFRRPLHGRYVGNEGKGASEAFHSACVSVGPDITRRYCACAEICSAFPTSGGLYFWSSRLAGKHGALASWVTGKAASLHVWHSKRGSQPPCKVIVHDNEGWRGALPYLSSPLRSGSDSDSDCKCKSFHFLPPSSVWYVGWFNLLGQVAITAGIVNSLVYNTGNEIVLKLTMSCFS
jgi:amino acid transporter